MRTLTNSQKKYLELVVIDRLKRERIPYWNIDLLTDKEWKHLKILNDTEILHQEADRYLMDMWFSECW